MGDANEISPVEIRRIEARWKSDIELKIDLIDRRLRTIERLVWIAVGGTFVVAGIATIGISMLLKQAERIETIGLTQAYGIAERKTQIESLKSKDAELQAQIDFIRNGRR